MSDGLGGVCDDTVATVVSRGYLDALHSWFDKRNRMHIDELAIGANEWEVQLQSQPILDSIRVNWIDNMNEENGNRCMRHCRNTR
jgi:hypothetical protein